MSSYKEQQEALEAEQSGLSKDEVIAMLKDARTESNKTKYEQIPDLDSIPNQQHNWVDRGVVMSCEGGNHPYHQVYKRGQL